MHLQITQQILSKTYEEKNPALITGIYRKDNQYSSSGFHFLKQLFDMCQGKYIAICEGDDFWIDPRKLQIQVDFLNNNPDYFMVSHNALVVDSNGEMKAKNPYLKEQQITVCELIRQRRGNLPTASLLVRKGIKDIDDFFLNYGVADWPLQLYSSEQGKIFYLDRIMSVYRSNHQNSWTSEYRNNIVNFLIHSIQIGQFLKQYDYYTHFRYQKYLISKIQTYVTAILEEAGEQLLEICRECDEKSKGKYYSQISEIKRIYLQTVDAVFIDKSIEPFVRSNKYIVIMGTGKFAEMLSRQLYNHQINYDGYIVSQKEGRDYFWDKPIWEVDDIPFEKKEVGVIIAINPIIWSEIYDTLWQSGYRKYICPYLFDYALLDKEN